MNNITTQIYKVSCAERLYAGEYPGSMNESEARSKIDELYNFGIRHFVDLTEEGELRPYNHLLPEGTTYRRFAINDCSAPTTVDDMRRILEYIENAQSWGGGVYLHCWGGIGRTGTVVACYHTLKMQNPTSEEAIVMLRNDYSAMPKSERRQTPETYGQYDFIVRFIKSLPKTDNTSTKSIPDAIRGCLMAGAAGDALGYKVEFISRNSILSHYGQRGITKFVLSTDGKAHISDDTQMTLFTANGILYGETHNAKFGIEVPLAKYAEAAYLDWYYTQFDDMEARAKRHDIRKTWLRNIRAMAELRAPGGTCLSACNTLLRGEEVMNSSKGCGGIMRVAPIALLNTAQPHTPREIAESAAESARCTHKHPLGFLPAALLAVLVSRLLPLTASQAKERIDGIVDETLGVLDEIYVGKYDTFKEQLRNITNKVVEVAHSTLSDSEAITMLGEGWVAEETWAIALYATLRHIDSVEDAIITAVNHDGDSDSTGAVCGNIMGAIYGYEYLRRRNIFCPEGHTLEQTLELSEVILALADDLAQGCPITNFEELDNEDKRHWYERYVNIKAEGIELK